MRIFISYSHQQIDWVKNRLVPCLSAGGAEIIIDYQHFTIGKAVVGQMDHWQDQADKHLLVLSPDYLKSDYCQHEMQRAIAKDPSFSHGLVLPVLREACNLPNVLSNFNQPIWADLTDDTAADRWQGLLRECGATGLGATAPDWLAARDEVVKYLQRGESVNLLVKGDANWRGLLNQLSHAGLPDLVQVDLQDPKTTSREGLLQSIADAIGVRTKLLEKPLDFATFSALFKNRPPVFLCLVNFDLVKHRHEEYTLDLFSSLRYLNMETRQLVMLIQSKVPFGGLLPPDNPLSAIDLKTVDLFNRFDKHLK